MLNALEVVGFKSFADKTRFEFPAGITVIVGPNGSGKSNVVDAIKWVLGEQSAKSLRGKDMADVIFKGGGARRPLNTAEATLVFDNSDQRFQFDAPEIHVTRRVYRGGEGEYLLNRQPCRLKDIRDLFRGVGVGADAYCLIEQGKVDRLLQAPPRERRAIFEEAAGISRFKAKKIETQSRLARVEQNLLRLSDIVDEVGQRLESLRAQASKARKYQEYTSRLRQLRAVVGAVDWRRLGDRAAANTRDLETLRAAAEQAAADAAAVEGHAQELEAEYERRQGAFQAEEAQLASCREQIAARESTLASLRARRRDLDDEERRLGAAWQAARAGAEALAERGRRLDEQVAEADAEARRLAAAAAEHAQALQALAAERAQLDAQLEARRGEQAELLRQAAALGDQLAAHESDAAAAAALRRRCQSRLEELAGEIQRQHALWQTQLRDCEGLQRKLDQAEAARQAAFRELEDGRGVIEQAHETLYRLQGEDAGLRQRVAVLQELERAREGVDAGAKEVLDAAQQDAARPNTSSPFAGVRGLAPDGWQVALDLAPLIDIALGARSHYLVLAETPDWLRLARAAHHLQGRAAFVVAPEVGAAAPPGVDLSFEDGVIGRADRLVEAPPEQRPLVELLLGTTWLVEKPADAERLRAEQARAGRGGAARFVTREGQLLESDGAWWMGPLRGAGVVARRSELRALQRQGKKTQEQIARQQEQIRQLRQGLGDHEKKLQDLRDARLRAADALADQRSRAEAAHRRSEELERETRAVADEMRTAQTRQEAALAQLAAAREEVAARRAAAEAAGQATRDLEARAAQLETRRQARADQAAALDIERAKSEQRREGLRTAQSQLAADARERDEALLAAQSQLRDARQRRQQLDREALRASSEAAELYLRKEHAARRLEAERRGRQEHVQERSRVNARRQAARQRQRAVEEKLQAAELAAHQLRLEREALEKRLREDYGLEPDEFARVEDGLTSEERAAAEQEIDALRRRLQKIGPVNTDALEELQGLEQRHAALAGQFTDLTEAKAALEKIIQRIDNDSRRLFTDTLDAIRANFQTLYRRAFGGGKADLVLEEGVDMLDAGVDIIATPPGKPSFNNSLLSGGEKALTAVALLMAIFQYRPSPFCVLDEVDAPFDEANIDRFVNVLKEFLHTTKFIVVSHSKKTMTAADTLYGVTMQESGVSKRVSVRFEDVSEDGEISAEALARGGSGEAAAEEATDAA